MARILQQEGRVRMQGGHLVKTDCKSCCNEDDDNDYQWPTTGYIKGSVCDGSTPNPDWAGKTVIMPVNVVKYYNDGTNFVIPSSCITGYGESYSPNYKKHCYSFSFNGQVLQLTDAQVNSGAYAQPIFVLGGFAPSCCDCMKGVGCAQGVGLGDDPAGVAQSIAFQQTRGISASVNVPTRTRPNGQQEYYVCCSGWNYPGSTGSKQSSGSWTYNYNSTTVGPYPYNNYDKRKEQASWGLTFTREQPTGLVYVHWESERGGENYPNGPQKSSGTTVVEIRGGGDHCGPHVFRSMAYCPFPGFTSNPVSFEAPGITATSSLSTNAYSFNGSCHTETTSASTGSRTTVDVSASLNESVSVSGLPCGGCGGGAVALMCSRITVDGYTLAAPPLPASTAPTGPGDFFPVEV